MKKKKLISAIVLFGLALSSCERCSDDPTKRSDTNYEEMLVKRNRFYYEVQVAWYAVNEALNRLERVPTTEAYEAAAEAFDRLALIFDRDRSRGWTLTIAIEDNGVVEQLSAEGCRAVAGRIRTRIEAIEADRRRMNVVAQRIIVPDALRDNDCPVCSDAPGHSRECPLCHKQFCRNCITTWLETINSRTGRPNDSCPYCRGKIELIPNDR